MTDNKVSCINCTHCTCDKLNPARLGMCELKKGWDKLVHIRTKKTCKDFEEVRE